MSVLRFVSQLLFPPQCRGCGERFDIFLTPDPLPLCPHCMEQWAAAKEMPCAQCGGAVGACACMPTLLQEAGCAALVKAVGYHPNQRDLAERLILRCKRARDRALFRFFAADLQLPLWQALAKVDGAENTVVTYVPRRARAIAEEGVDQGRELACAIGRALEIPVVKTLRNRGRQAQKTLDHTQRAAQAAKVIGLRGERSARDVQGKTVVLVDDITTAGATLAAATRLLLTAGAARVVCCVVGATPLQKNT